MKKYLITCCLLAACAAEVPGTEDVPPFELHAGSGGALPDAAGSFADMAGAASEAAGADAAGTGAAAAGTSGTAAGTTGTAGAAGMAGAAGAAGGAAGSAGSAAGGAAGSAGTAGMTAVAGSGAGASGAAGAAGMTAADVSAPFCHVKAGPKAGSTYGCAYVPAGFRISWKVDATYYHCGAKGWSLYPQKCVAGASCTLVVLDSTGQPDGGYSGVCQ